MRILLLALLAISTVLGQTKNTKTDLENLNLKGNVKSFKYRLDRLSFNENGYEIMREKFDESDTTFIVRKTVTILDENNLKLEEKEYTGDRLLKLVSYKYNAKNQLLKTTSTEYRQSGNFEEVCDYGYDPNWNLISRKYNNTNKRKEEDSYPFTCKYKTNMLIEKIEQDRKVKIIHSYNNNQQETKMQYIDSNGSIMLSVEFSYDDKGNKIQERKTNDDGRGKSITIYTYSYNQNNSLIKELHHTESNEHDTTINYEYQFDSHGNWIKKTSTILSFGKTVNTNIVEEKRTIDYFD